MLRAGVGDARVHGVDDGGRNHDRVVQAVDEVALRAALEEGAK